MKTYEVWYAIKPTFFVEEPIAREGLEATHRQVTTIQAKSPDDAFRQMQAEVWSPRGEARTWIESLGLSHTSMSVGDVLWDIEAGVALTCAFAGWLEKEAS